LKLVLDTSLSAKGVEFVCGGIVYQVAASSEVILAAGSLQTPRLLELSGIGDPKVLDAAGVECVVSLPSVGANLQDHPMTSLTYAIAKPPSDGERGSADGVSVVAFLPYDKLVSGSELSHTVSQVEQCSYISEAERQLILGRLRNGTVPTLQFNGASAYIDIGGGYDNQGKLRLDTTDHETNYYSYHVTMTRPLSRGSCHITSRDPLIAPSINLALLENQVDVDILLAGLNFVDSVFASSHVTDWVVGRVAPSPGVNLKDREQGNKFVRGWTTSFNHILGTCSMGLVTDERLRVKGVRGLRVVDASVMPSQISGNIMATVYAVAEKAADLIKEDYVSWSS
jgi:choline dehydrogenase-like flavoprotein